MKNDLLCVHVGRETLLKALSAEAILAKSGIDLLDAARLISEISEIGGTKNLKTLRRIFSLGREAFSRKRRALSFRAAAAEFLSVKSHLRKRTLSDYRQTFAAIFRADPSARDANLRSLERDADFFRALISDAFRTPRQRVKARAVLHAFFSCAVRRGWCESNPIAGVDFPMPREQEIVPLSPEEIDALFAAAERLSLRECVPAMALMIFAGIRPREIERLSWKCINREERVVSVMPAHSKTQPIFNLIMELGLYDKLAGVTLVYLSTGMAMSIFILRAGFLSIPKSLDEAAIVDGAGFLRIFWSINLPLAKGALATAGILMFLSNWNEYYFASLLTMSDSQRTLPVALSYFTSEFSYNYTQLFAALTIVVLPGIILYIFAQEQVQTSMASTGIKG